MAPHCANLVAEGWRQTTGSTRSSFRVHDPGMSNVDQSNGSATPAKQVAGVVPIPGPIGLLKRIPSAAGGHRVVSERRLWTTALAFCMHCAFP